MPQPRRLRFVLPDEPPFARRFVVPFEPRFLPNEPRLKTRFVLHNEPRLKTRFVLHVFSLLIAIVPALARAQSPAPIGDPALAFPGGYPSPSDAENAAHAMADTWLGVTPYSNPAAPVEWTAGLSAFALHVGRQDLRAHNRNYDEVTIHLGGGGAMFGAPLTPRLAVWAYAWRPESRFEENTFNAGTGSDPTVQPAVITNHVETRETRAGAGVTTMLGTLRVGAAVELTSRNDLYRHDLQAGGGPGSGTSELAFSATAVGGQAGLHWSRGTTPRGMLELGGAARWLPALDVTGTASAPLTGSSDVAATRESGWEGGVSAAYGVAEAIRLIAGVGGRTAQTWDGLGVESGASLQWSIAADLHDARDPWAVHLGGGHATQDGAPEPSSNLFSIGGDWQFTNVRASVGVLRRALHRDGEPTSYDDRFFGGFTAHW